MISQPLRGRKVAILLAPAGSEQVEFTEPKQAVKDAGAYVDVIGAEPEAVESWRIALSLAARAVIAGSLALLGVSAPESM